MYTYVSLIIIFPLLGFLVNGLIGSRIKSEKLSGIIGTAAVALPFLIACAIFIEMLGTPVEERKHVVTLFQWIAAGSLTIPIAYQIDQLSILMTLVVTGVGSLIHLYSIGYMHGD